MILSPAELAALTARVRPSAQRRVLDSLGVPYRVRRVSAASTDRLKWSGASRLG